MSIDVCSWCSKCEEGCNTFMGMFQPVEVPMEWTGRIVQPLLQNGCVLIVSVAAITALYAACISSIPLVVISVGVVVLSLRGSYLLRKEIYPPESPIRSLDALLTPLQQKALQEKRDHLHDFIYPKPDELLREQLFRHQMTLLEPEKYTEEEKQEIRAPFTAGPPPTEETKQRMLQAAAMLKNSIAEYQKRVLSETKPGGR